MFLDLLSGFPPVRHKVSWINQGDKGYPHRFVYIAGTAWEKIGVVAFNIVPGKKSCLNYPMVIGHKDALKGSTIVCRRSLRGVHILHFVQEIELV